MKKLLTIMLTLYSAIGMAQGPGVPKPEGYTWISHRYDWLSGKFRGLHVPAGTTPTLVSGQFTGAGAVFVDSVNHRFYFYSGGQWRFGGGIDSVTYSTDSTKIWQGGVSFGIPKGGFFSPNQTSAANTTHNAAGFNLTINNVGTLTLASSSLNITGSTLVDIQTPSFQAYSDEVESDDVGMVQTLAGLAQIEAFDDDPEGDLFIGTYLRGRYTLGENTYGSVAIMGMAASTGPPISYVMVDSTNIRFKGALYNFNNVATTTDTSTYTPFVINASGDVRRFTFWPGGSGGGGSGIGEVVAGFGLLNINDSTLALDTADADLKEWKKNNLIVEPLGAGLDIVSPRNDSLFHRLVIADTLATVDTLSDGTFVIGIDTAALSEFIADRASGGGPATVTDSIQVVGDPSEMTGNIAVDTTRDRIVYKIGNIYRYVPITDSSFVLTQLSTPGSFNATTFDDDRIDLSWTDVANESNYEIQRGLASDYSDASTINSPAAGSTSYNNTGLNPSTTYYYRIRAVGDGVSYSSSNWATDNATTNAASAPFLVFTSTDAFTESPTGTWNRTGANLRMVSTGTINSSTDGYIQAKYVSSSNVGSVIGLDNDATQGTFSIMMFGLYPSAGVWQRVENGSITSTGVTATVGDFYRLRRSGSNVIAEYSANGTSWTTIHTFGTTTTAELWGKLHVSVASGVASEVRGENF